MNYEDCNLSLIQSWRRDALWMAAFKVDAVPFWSAWNTKLCKDTSEIQKVWYLPQINESPTSRAVVAETMNRSIAIADEAGRFSIAVTYDLAVARLAFEIQRDHCPK